MLDRSIENSPQTYARIGGWMYLVIIVAGGLDEGVVRSGLIVHGDAAATAQKIMASERLFRISIAGDLVMHILDIPLMLIFYVLLRPISKTLSLFGLLFNIVQTAVLAINKVNLLTTLTLLSGASFLKTVDPHQLQAMAFLSINVHEDGFGIGLVFFGFRCLVVGYLMFRSGYFPRGLGVLQVIAGLSYIINSFSLILSPPFASAMFPWILLPALVGELSLCLYMIVVGVNPGGWKEMKIGLL